MPGGRKIGPAVRGAAGHARYRVGRYAVGFIYNYIYAAHKVSGSALGLSYGDVRMCRYANVQMGGEMRISGRFTGVTVWKP